VEERGYPPPLQDYVAMVNVFVPMGGNNVHGIITTHVISGDAQTNKQTNRNGSSYTPM